MTNHNIKNLSASVKARLLSLARNTKRPFQELLQYYGIERFLFRLSESDHSNIFILKGALLLKVWEISDSRATMDIDTLARTSNSLENLTKIIKEICEHIPSIDDGVEFYSSSIKGEKMQLLKEYEGIRIRFEGRLGSARIPMQIDIGFGDVITPAAEESQYPNLLDFPGPKLKTYSQETLIAEKVLTMVERGEINSRIKDFYDVWLLFRRNLFFHETLRLALKRTFKSRKMKYDFETVRSSIEEYLKNVQTKVLWERFKRKKMPEIYQHLSFDSLTREIIDFLKKIEENIYSSIKDIVNSDENLFSILQHMIQGKLKGKLLYEALKKKLSQEKNIESQNINGHRILQLLIEKARLNEQKKLELIKKAVNCGAEIDIVDRSGLTPFQVAVRNRNKKIADYLLSKGAIDKVPIYMHSDYYHLYLRFPMP